MSLTQRWNAVKPYAGGIALVVAAASVRLIPGFRLSATTALLILAVLVTALKWGTRPGLVAAGMAVVAYVVILLTQTTFGVEPENDLITAVVFAATAMIVGELVARSRQQAEENAKAREEIERLYRQLETAFDRASEAEAARRNEQIKTALLDALTHNLRTPLTAIKASVTALLTPGAGGESMPESARRTLLSVIDEESDRLNRFVEGLTTAGSTEASRPAAYEPKTVDDLVQAAVDRAATVTKHHVVDVHLRADLPALSVDAAAVTEVLYMLLDNASKYSPIGGRIRIGADADGDRVRIIVVDEGPGIPPEYREKVFEKFFRMPGREATDPRRSGVGLGLSIARRLIDAQGGRAWVEGGPGGRGTIAVVELPAAAGPRIDAGHDAPRAVAEKRTA
jgi:two-component system sensor histidine kinase KdpD